MRGGSVKLDPGAEEFWPKPAQHFSDQFSLPYAPIFYPCHSTAVRLLPYYESCTPYVQPLVVTGHPNAFAGWSSSSPSSATRSLLLSSVPKYVSETQLRGELEVFGPVRAIQMDHLENDGTVIVHFYDLRDAQAALTEIQQQHLRQQCRLGQQFSFLMRNCWLEELVLSPPAPPGLLGGSAVWAQFALSTTAGPDVHNQGTIVVFNLDSEVSSDELRAIFEVYGTVRELRETPSKRNHRFIEFFDVRDADRALSEMNGKEMFGKRLMIEFSRPGGQGRRPLNGSPSALDLSLSNYSSLALSSGATTHAPHTQPRLPHLSDSANNPSGGLEELGKAMSKVDGRNIGKNREPRRSGQSRPENRRSSKSHKKRADKNLVFVEDSATADCRTTVMIKNIPNKYSQKLFLDLLDDHCIRCNTQIAAESDEHSSAYDFVYLPIDFYNKCNVGYGFVNLTSPEAAWRLYKFFHGRPWEVFNSRKICEVSYARLQGLESLKEHFRNSKFACDTDEYLPVVFSPPRDGKKRTAPVAVGAHSAAGDFKIMIRSGSELTNGEESTTSNNWTADGDDGGASDGEDD